MIRAARRVARASLAVFAALAACGGPSAPAGPAYETWEDGPAAETVPPPPERPLRVDLNDSTAEDLMSIPGVGAATAARIIEHRPFKSVDDLGRVPGFGLRTIENLREYVYVAGAETNVRRAGGKVNINTATAAEFETLPGIGPGLARTIVKYREGNGPFRTIHDLQKVPGIGHGRFAKIADRLTI